MEYNDNSMVKKVAELTNINAMILFVLVAVVALSVGLGFFFLVPGTVGYAVGITMFIVAGLLFLIGEIQYFSKMMRIRNNLQ